MRWIKERNAAATNAHKKRLADVDSEYKNITKIVQTHPDAPHASVMHLAIVVAAFARFSASALNFPEAETTRTVRFSVIWPRSSTSDQTIRSSAVS